MTSYAWDPSLETGHPIIDAQHLDLFNTIESLYVDITQNNNAKAVEDSLIRLNGYIASHFADEEELMASCAYPGFAAQRRMHQEFTESTNELLQKYLSGEPILPMTVAVHIFEWLEHHVRTADREMAIFVREAEQLG